MKALSLLCVTAIVIMIVHEYAGLTSVQMEGEFRLREQLMREMARVQKPEPRVEVPTLRNQNL